MNDKKSRFDDSSLRSMKTSARKKDNIEYSVIVVTQHTIERSQDELKKYKKKVNNWDERHDKIVIRIHLNCFIRSRVHIKDIEETFKMWVILKKHYDISSLSTRDKTYLQLRRFSQLNFKFIQKYAKHLKKTQSKLRELDHNSSDCELIIFFRLNINSDLESYIFSLIEMTRLNERELKLDEMIMVLIDHDRRQNNLDEFNQSLSTKFNKKEEKNKKTKNKKNKKNFRTYEYCKLSDYIMSTCFYINVTGWSDSFKSLNEKKNLRKYKKKSKNNKNKNKKTSSSKTIFVLRSMRISSERSDRDQTWWIDSASDLHICFDRVSLMTIVINLSMIRWYESSTSRSHQSRVLTTLSWIWTFTTIHRSCVWRTYIMFLTQNIICFRWELLNSENLNFK